MRISDLSSDVCSSDLALSRSLSLKAAQPRYEAFLELVPAHIAQRARTLTGQPLARALSLWEKARDLAASAVPLSLDPQSVVFELAGLLAALDNSSEPEAARYRSEEHTSELQALMRISYIAFCL